MLEAGGACTDPHLTAFRVYLIALSSTFRNARCSATGSAATGSCGRSAMNSMRIRVVRGRYAVASEPRISTRSAFCGAGAGGSGSGRARRQALGELDLAREVGEYSALRLSATGRLLDEVGVDADDRSGERRSCRISA
jgi:hypothetical protein